MSFSLGIGCTCGQRWTAYISWSRSIWLAKWLVNRLHMQAFDQICLSPSICVLRGKSAGLLMQCQDSRGHVCVVFAVYAPPERPLTKPGPQPTEPAPAERSPTLPRTSLPKAADWPRSTSLSSFHRGMSQRRGQMHTRCDSGPV